ncbi:MAG: ABC transporter ATP-binding protein/permease [Clostridia bacterium]|nr:ABC transporter ATP-binding protein/permease [Clostridia bacterium]
MKLIFQYLKNYKVMAIMAPLFKLMEVIFELLVPKFVAQIINVGINGDAGWQYILVRCIILVAFGIVGYAAGVVAQWFAAKAAVGVSKDLRADMFRRIEALSYADLDKAGTSTLINRITNDVNQIQQGVNMILRLFLRSPIVVFGAMIMAFTVSWKAGIVFAIAICVLFAVVFAIMFVTMPMYKKVQGNMDGVTLATRETLAGSRVIRAFCKEEEEISNYNEKVEKLAKSQKHVGRISSLLNPLTYVIINLGIIALIYTGVLQFNSGELLQGDIVELYNYMSQILIELIKVANLVMIITKSLASSARVKAVLDMTSTLKHTPAALPEGAAAEGAMAVAADGTLAAATEGSVVAAEPAAVPGAPFVSFKNVCMRYSDGAECAIKDISFDAERGQTIGVIGGTGSGKTTLINLIPHFYDATDGEVEIEGVNVNAYGDERLRDMCGVVPQKAVLFRGTLRENMQWGDDNATDDDIYEALQTAQALDIVKAKERGLDEPVEQMGKNFSGGQRQRLTIARALVKKPEILILDDSASALDYATDANLRKSLKDLSFKPLVFIVSQRASSVRNADKIIVLDGGKAVGVGTHDELVKSCDVYKEICMAQYGTEGGAA